MTVQALLSSARGFANAVSRRAIQDKRFAQELVFMHGVRGNITPKTLKGITKDMFNASGKLTKPGATEVQRVISETGLSQNATWDQIIEAVAKMKQHAVAKIEKLSLPNS